MLGGVVQMAKNHRAMELGCRDIEGEYIYASAKNVQPLQMERNASLIEEEVQCFLEKPQAKGPSF